jgi:transposase
MGAPPKADWREERRKRAWALKHKGWPQKQIATALGVSEGAVSQWLRRAREGGGVEALTRRPPPGMTPRLSAEQRAQQRAQLPALLARGAPAYGFAGDVWTAKRVAVVIERTFGVRSSRDHVSRIVRACGWSRQQPSTRAAQRDEAKITAWVEERWPARKKGRTKRERPSSGETNRAFLCCRWRSGRGRRADVGAAGTDADAARAAHA